MEKNIQKILEFLRAADNYLITSHMNADGDAYASMLSVAYLFEKWGKQYRIIIHDQKPDHKYNFMWGFDKISPFSSDNSVRFEAAVVLDVPSKERMGDPSELLPPRDFCVKIDHHPVEKDFAAYNMVNTEISSTSHLVYELISRSDIQIDHDLANLIFSGIMYDTGRFSFSNTSLRDFQIASHLLEYSVKPSQIANQLFFNCSFEAMKTIGYGLANMKSYLDGKLSIIFLPLEVMQKNHHSEIEELSNYSVAIRGVEVGLFVREVEPNFFKVSFRSKGRINVNAIAKAFGGGGHMHAAGCRYEGKFEELIKGLVEEVGKHFE
ncbi:MAG: bifunctional oligoribonuclease/PAP phosphatase NrnA [Calditrichia bacterium]